jgi:hypothetical protein
MSSAKQCLLHAPDGVSRRTGLFVKTLGRLSKEPWPFFTSALVGVDGCKGALLSHAVYFHKTRTMTDQDTAIRYFQESLNLTPEGHLTRASLLEALGYGYSSRTQVDHPDRAKRLKALGNGYRDSVGITGLPIWAGTK